MTSTSYESRDIGSAKGLMNCTCTFMCRPIDAWVASRSSAGERRTSKLFGPAPRKMTPVENISPMLECQNHFDWVLSGHLKHIIYFPRSHGRREITNRLSTSSPICAKPCLLQGSFLVVIGTTRHNFMDEKNLC